MYRNIHRNYLSIQSDSAKCVGDKMSFTNTGIFFLNLYRLCFYFIIFFKLYAFILLTSTLIFFNCRYAFILLTSTLAPGINYCVESSYKLQLILHPLHQLQVRKRSSSICVCDCFDIA